MLQSRVTCPDHASNSCVSKICPAEFKTISLGANCFFSFPRTHFLEPIDWSPVNCSYHSSKVIRQKYESFTSVLFSANHIFGGKFKNQKWLKYLSFHFAFYMGCVILKAVITCVELSVTRSTVTKYCVTNPN